MDSYFIGFVLYPVFIGGVFVFGLWAHTKGIPVKWYELLSVVAGSLLGLMTIVYVINYVSAVWLLFLVPALALVLFGWWRVINRYKSNSNNS